MVRSVARQGVSIRTPLKAPFGHCTGSGRTAKSGSFSVALHFTLIVCARTNKLCFDKHDEEAITAPAGRSSCDGGQWDSFPAHVPLFRYSSASTHGAKPVGQRAVLSGLRRCSIAVSVTNRSSFASLQKHASCPSWNTPGCFPSRTLVPVRLGALPRPATPIEPSAGADHAPLVDPVAWHRWPGRGVRFDRFRCLVLPIPHAPERQRLAWRVSASLSGMPLGSAKIPHTVRQTSSFRAKPDQESERAVWCFATFSLLHGVEDQLCRRDERAPLPART